MMKKIISLYLLFILNFLIYPQSEKEYQIDEIVITSGRISIPSSDLNRNLFVITNKDLRKLPATNIIDILKFISSVDLRSRGVEGVQSDISIRGGNFEQTLIMIDGVKISDPQTGHHNLNLPLSIDNIDRIEILKGEGSRSFGANAFSGAINFITKKEKSSTLSISILGGQNNLFETAVSGSLPIFFSTNNFSLSKKKSDGYRHNTNFDITNFTFNQTLSFNKAVLNLFTGYIDKKFGANSFYSDRFPDQWEHTKTKMAHLTSEVDLSGIIISPKIYWRENDDDYRLDNNRPEWYRNIHKTNSYGFEIQSTFKSMIGKISFGAEVAWDEIISSNLGNHKRSKRGLFLENIFEPLEKISISIGGFAYNYTNIGWQIWPGINAGYQLSNEVRIFSSYGKAFRIPTFTELFYTSPANMGNPLLIHEQTNNFEIGARYKNNYIQANFALFIKNGNNIIDWVRRSYDEPWRVENVTEIQTRGIELSFSLDSSYIFDYAPIRNINFGYTYLNSNRKAGIYESRYLLDHLKHHFVLSISNKLPFSVNQNWILRFEEREHFNSNFIINTQFTKKINHFDIYILLSNIFNSSNFDLSGIPLPGRLISAGVKFHLSDKSN
jgi:iron complex outermembrane receptor protein